MKKTNIIGISAYYHDSAACLLQDGEIIAAAQEERFTRKKHDPSFPIHAIKFCLSFANLNPSDIDFIIFYDKPLLKFERLLETYLNHAPKGFQSYITAMPIWLKDKLYLKSIMKNELSRELGIEKNKIPKILFSEHHQSHAASAYFPSPFNEAAVLCLDGVGEWATTSAWIAKENKLSPSWQINFPDSLGLLYSAFTYYTGFKVNSGEYKVMGLAPYGTPKYTKIILEKLIDLKPDGTFKLNMEYFDFATGLKMTNDRFSNLFGGPPRSPESNVTQKEMDLARSIQVVTEEIVLKLAKTIHHETGMKNLCMAGGVALNCVANGQLHRNGPFENIWIQPAAGDAGGALGAAYICWHEYLGKPRSSSNTDRMKGSYLGTTIKNESAKTQLENAGAIFHYYDDAEIINKTTDILANEMVVGWVQGSMEFGPRALGNRSILGDPRSTKMQSIMNLKIKYRESFRPFAPAILAEKVSEYFEYQGTSPYMLMVAPVNESIRIKMSDSDQNKFGIEKLNIPKSTIPAITHVDYSARIQTVHSDTNPRFYRLIKSFEEKTKCPVLVNTSFNVRGEPIVNDAADAYRCFMRTEMDCLVVGNYLMIKSEQPKNEENEKWKEEFTLD